MPKLTKDFQESLDYQEAFRNADKGLIFIGHSEGATVLITYKKDIGLRGDQSDYFGCVVFPERRKKHGVTK